MFIFGQEKKTINALRIIDPVKIDGELNEDTWANAEIADKFVEFRPNNGSSENPNQKTVARILYDNDAVYFGLEMFDNQPDSILTQLTKRDDVGAADYILVAINPYNDGQQSFEFLVTAAGVQFDAFATQQNEDNSWDAVWESDVKITDKGWVAEIKIPYSALRFPKQDVNTWALNFWRQVQRYKIQTNWNFIDRSKNNYLQFMGLLKGINNINPPTRLFLIPYASLQTTTFDGNSKTQFKAGADIKWGISDSYTLDAILIPDFGQTAADEVTYQLGPFEQEFSEKRSFFTESIDLFQKGDLLYTRRIGQAPTYQPFLEEDENLNNYPVSTNLINALKISGRGKKGLGIGFLNALMEKTEAEVYNENTNTARQVIVSPLTNYNEIVIDKRFGQNNSVTFVNTNTLRDGNYRDSNVSALLFDWTDKKNKNNFWGEAKYSIVKDTNDKNGFWGAGGWEEVDGQFHYGIYGRYVDENFDINDLGINFYQDYQLYQAWANYKIIKSTKMFNTLNINSSSSLKINNPTGKIEEYNFNFNFNSTDKKNDYNGFGLGLKPFTAYDFYEPRTEGRYMKIFPDVSFWFTRSPDYNKKFLMEYNTYIYKKNQKGMWGYGIDITPRWKISDHILLSYGIQYDKYNKDYGYITTINNQIIVGERNQFELENILKADYTINPSISMSLNLRHYWTGVQYNDFYNLEQNGEYTLTTYTENEDFTYNNWNIDYNFSWWFAPGSQLTFLYRNSLNSYESLYNKNIGNNYEYLFKNPSSHTFSLRLTYFFDMNKLKNVLKKKELKIN